MVYKKSSRVNAFFPRKRSSALSKPQVKAVKQIAKKTTLQVAETKVYQNHDQLSLTSDFWQVRNLIYPMSQGTTSVNVIGEKIHLKSINLRCVYRTESARTDQIQFIRCALIKSKHDYTNTSSVVTSTELVKSPTANSPVCDIFDYHKITVLRQYKRVLTPQTTKGAACIFDFNVPINKTEYFQVDNGGYLKYGNYYLVAMATDASGINTCGQFIFNWNVNFKDE